MDFAMKELKRLVRLNHFILIGIFTIVVYAGCVYFNQEFLLSYKNLLRNVFLIFLIIVSTAIAVDDLEYKTFRMVYFGKYNFKEVIFYKIVVGNLIASMMASYMNLVDYLVLRHELTMNQIMHVWLENYVSYFICATCLVCFAILIGFVVKKYQTTLFLMFVLFFGVVALALSYVTRLGGEGGMNFLKYLPFLIVPNLLVNGVFEWIDFMVLSFFSIGVFLLITMRGYRWFE